eukprot:c19376_g1_i4 orf=473-1426(-)
MERNYLIKDGRTRQKTLNGIIKHILNIKDELAYDLQACSLLEEVEDFLHKRQVIVTQLSEKCTQHLKVLQEIIGSQKCVPNELAYPELRAVGKLQRTISDELRALRSQSKTAASLLLLSAEPSFRRTPSGLTKLSTNANRANLTIMINGLAFLPDEISASNFDQTGNMFMKAPFHFLEMVYRVAIMLPQLVNLLKLQQETPFFYLAISDVIDAVTEPPLLCDFSTQTENHILPLHQWNDETLYKRALQLAGKKTHSTQTNNSHFHQDTDVQVWQLKEKATQSKFCKGTSMPKRVKYFENLCGPPDCKFNAMDIMLEV